MKSNKLRNFHNQNEKNKNDFNSDLKTGKQHQETELKKNLNQPTAEKECAQNLNEEYFLMRTQTNFNPDIEQSGINLDSSIRNIRLKDIEKSTKKKLKSSFDTPSKKEKEIKELREIIQKRSIIMTVQRELKTVKLFRSPPPKTSSLRVRGRLFVSRSRITQIKKNLKKSKIQRTINKPDRKLKVKPIQNRLIKREFLRKRKRDMSNLNPKTREVKCWNCGRLVHYSADIMNQEFYNKTGEVGVVRIKDIFRVVDKLCSKCESKKSNKNLILAENSSKSEKDKRISERVLKWPVKGFSNINADEDSKSFSDESNLSNLSDISLKNNQIKKILHFKQDKDNIISKKTPNDVREKQFVCSSARGTFYFPFYRKEEEKMIFENDLDLKLNPMKDDEDFDTDEEIINQNINKVSTYFLKRLHKVSRQKR